MKLISRYVAYSSDFECVSTNLEFADRIGSEGTIFLRGSETKRDLDHI